MPAKKVVTPPKATAPTAAPEDPNAPIKLVCKIHHFWGTDIIVGLKDSPTGPVPNTFTIGKDDGAITVPKDIAKILLANTEKYAPYSVLSKTPGKRLTFAEANPGIPNAILRDPRTGRILDDDEALRLLAPPDLKSRDSVGGTGKMAGDATDPIAAQAAQIQATERPKNVIDIKKSVDVLANGQIVDATDVDRTKQIADEKLVIEQEQLADAAKALEASPAVGAEPAPSAEWPEVTMDTTKAAMVEVLGRLKDAKAVKAFDPKAAKKDLLDQIERGYEKLGAE